MDYDELVDDIVKQVHARYDDYVEYRKSNGLVVDSFDEVVEQLLDDELNDSLIYYHQMWTIIESIPVTILVHCSMTEQHRLMAEHLTKHSTATV